MSGAVHSGYVDVLAQNGAATRRFKAAILELVECEDAFSWWRAIPDAYLINHECDEITVWEVEVGHPLTPERILEYADLWFYLDCECWTLRLITVDRFGVPTEQSLMSVWYAQLGQERAAA